MKFIYTIIAILLIFTTAFFHGCILFPKTKISEKEVTEKVWKSVNDHRILSQNKQYLEALDRVGKQLEKLTLFKNAKWEYKVFDSPAPNVFSLPGGKVAAYSGLFRFAVNDAELAAAVVREMLHANRAHGIEIIVERFDGKIPETVELIKIFGAGTSSSHLFPYPVHVEMETDAEGMRLLAEAGYEPSAMISLLKKLTAVQEANIVALTLKPNSVAGRIAALEKQLPQAKKIYSGLKDKLDKGVVYDKAMTSPSVPASNGSETAVKADNFGYQLMCPPGWLFDKNDKNLTLSMISPDRTASVYIHNLIPKNEGKKIITADAACNTLLQTIKTKYPKFKIVKRGNTFVKRRRSPEFHAEYTMNGQKWSQWTIIYSRRDNQMLYVFSYYAPEDNYKKLLPFAGKILKSFTTVSFAVKVADDKNQFASTPLTPEAKEISDHIDKTIDNQINEYKDLLKRLDSMSRREGLVKGLHHKRCPRCKNIIIYDKGHYRWICKRCGKVMFDFSRMPMSNGKTLKEEIANQRRKTAVLVKKLRALGNKQLAEIDHPPMWDENAPVFSKRQRTHSSKPSQGLSFIHTQSAQGTATPPSLRDNNMAAAALPQIPKNPAARIVFERVSRDIKAASYDGNRDFNANSAALLYGREKYQNVKCPKCGSNTGYDYGHYRWICPKCKHEIADLLDAPYKGTTVRKYLVEQEDLAREKIQKIRREGNKALRQKNQPPLWNENDPITNVTDHRVRETSDDNSK